MVKGGLITFGDKQNMVMNCTGGGFGRRDITVALPQASATMALSMSVAMVSTAGPEMVVVFVPPCG